MTKKLAIIIPAYKSTFLRETLISIANQTCKDFNLYIGDDASPYDIYSIVSDFEKDINITYKRFHDNFGAIDLVAQWERCIDLSKDEEYIWLFSDDDTMENTCVHELYKLFNSTLLDIENKVIRFRRCVIDSNNMIKDQNFEMPIEYNVEYLLNRQMQGNFAANIIEHVFSRKLYQEMGGYINLPLAWGTDALTILKFGNRSGFISLKSSIYWRSSNENISNLKMYSEKLKTQYSVNKWLYPFYKKFYYDKKLYLKLENSRFEFIKYYIELPFDELYNYILSLNVDFNISKLKIYLIFIPKLTIWKTKQKIKNYVMINMKYLYGILLQLKVWK